jgi:hypothetical protein
MPDVRVLMLTGGADNAQSMGHFLEEGGPTPSPLTLNPTP